MSIFYIVLLVLISALSVGVQSYWMYKRKEFKALGVSVGILGAAVVLGGLAILRLPIPSATKLLVAMLPWK
jgi:hypothetical protein